MTKESEAKAESLEAAPRAVLSRRAKARTKAEAERSELEKEMADLEELAA